ncbi:hypothetical protein PBN151_1350 [Paenibacillus sp. NAIST15-1]|nr:hypothetical protein PBN151_1350 [Paenibacillus sp. NAIST15-1]
MDCDHREIIIGNTEGAKLGSGVYEVDFVISCNVCEKELFRISECKRIINNISKH